MARRLSEEFRAIPVLRSHDRDNKEELLRKAIAELDLLKAKESARIQRIRRAEKEKEFLSEPRFEPRFESEDPSLTVYRSANHTDEVANLRRSQIDMQKQLDEMLSREKEREKELQHEKDELHRSKKELDRQRRENEELRRRQREIEKRKAKKRNEDWIQEAYENHRERQRPKSVDMIHSRRRKKRFSLDADAHSLSDDSVGTSLETPEDYEGNSDRGESEEGFPDMGEPLAISYKVGKPDCIPREPPNWDKMFLRHGIKWVPILEGDGHLKVIKWKQIPINVSIYPIPHARGSIRDVYHLSERGKRNTSSPVVNASSPPSTVVNGTGITDQALLRYGSTPQKTASKNATQEENVVPLVGKVT